MAARDSKLSQAKPLKFKYSVSDSSLDPALGSIHLLSLSVPEAALWAHAICLFSVEGRKERTEDFSSFSQVEKKGIPSSQPARLREARN